MKVFGWSKSICVNRISKYWILNTSASSKGHCTLVGIFSAIVLRYDVLRNHGHHSVSAQYSTSLSPLWRARFFTLRFEAQCITKSLNYMQFQEITRFIPANKNLWESLSYFSVSFQMQCCMLHCVKWSLLLVGRTNEPPIDQRDNNWWLKQPWTA